MLQAEQFIGAIPRISNNKCLYEESSSLRTAPRRVLHMSRFQSFRFYISWSFFLRRSPKRPGPSSRKRTRDTDHFAGWSCSTCPSGESYWIFRHGVWPDFFGGAPPLRKLRRPKRKRVPGNQPTKWAPKPSVSFCQEGCMFQRQLRTR